MIAPKLMFDYFQTLEAACESIDPCKSAYKDNKPKTLYNAAIQNIERSQPYKGKTL